MLEAERLHRGVVGEQNVREGPTVAAEESVARDRPGGHPLLGLLHLYGLLHGASGSHENLSKKVRSSGRPFSLNTLIAASIMPGLPQRYASWLSMRS